MAERRYELGLFKFRPKSIVEEAYSSDLGRIHIVYWVFTIFNIFKLL